MIDLAYRDRQRQGGFDFEALETATRSVLHACGAMVLEYLLEMEDGSALSRSCPCGGSFLDHKCQEKTVRSVLGPLQLRRTRQRCNRCGSWRVPEDLLLDVVKTGFSPGLRRMMAKSGSELSFERAGSLLEELAGVQVTPKEIERVSEKIGGDIARWQQAQVERAMQAQPPGVEIQQAPQTLCIAQDATGVPVLRRETEGRKGKAADGQARTREVKLGAVFTQSTADAEGPPVRDPQSTTYVGKIETAESFGPRLYSEALQRGLEKASRVVVLGDGAPWIWNLAEEHFPGAIQILDFYHAQEKLCGLAKLLHPENPVARQAWLDPLAELLWQGQIPVLLQRLRRLRSHPAEVKTTLEYFQNNQQRMRYGQFRAQNLFIGSGVVEAGCRSVIGERLKKSGMHWSVRGANAIIALRCCIESHRFEDYWQERRAA